MLDRLLGRKKVPLKDQVKEWTRGLKKEVRGLEREIRGIDREEKKIKMQIRKLAKSRDNIKAINILAKGLVRSQKGKNKLYEARARVSSVCTQLRLNYAQVEVVQTMEKSGTILKAMGQLMSLPKLRNACKELSRQMMKAGIIDEVMEDAFESLEDEDTEELAQQEADKILFEITEGQLGKVGKVKNKLEAKEDKVEVKEEDKDIEDLKRRLEALN